MSGHERERLSAYLDGELSAADAAAVESHLAGCVECSACLADMAAVDERFRESPAAPPAGYFDTFAPRVRARIEAEPRRAAGRRLPAWTWAAAAALLLAVVTPLTLRGRLAVPPAAAPESARSQAPAVAPAQEATAGAALPPAGPPESKQERVRPISAPAGAQVGEVVRQPGPAAAPGLLDRGAAAREAPARGPEGGHAKAAAAGDERGANEAADTPGGVVGGVVGGIPGEPPAPAAPAATAEREGAPTVAMVGAGLSAESRAKATQARSASAPPLAEADAAGRAEPAALAFGRLETAAPRTAGEWRHAREGWITFAADHPSHPRADEARVRAVEAAFEALRASGDDADRRSLASVAAAYLARADAARRDHVREILRRAEALPR